MHQDRTDLDPRAAVVSNKKRDAVRTWYKRNGLEPKRRKNVNADLKWCRETTQIVNMSL